MNKKAGSILIGFLVLVAASMVFVSEAPAPGYPEMSITKFCTNPSGPEQPIEFSAVIKKTITKSRAFTLRHVATINLALS